MSYERGSNVNPTLIDLHCWYNSRCASLQFSSLKTVTSNHTCKPASISELSREDIAVRIQFPQFSTPLVYRGDNRSEMASSYTCDLKLRHQSCIKLHKNCKYKQTLKWTRINFLYSIQLPIQSAPPVGFMTSRWRVLIWRKSWTAFCFLQ